MAERKALSTRSASINDHRRKRTRADANRRKRGTDSGSLEKRRARPCRNRWFPVKTHETKGLRSVYRFVFNRLLSSVRRCCQHNDTRNVTRHEALPEAGAKKGPNDNSLGRIDRLLTSFIFRLATSVLLPAALQTAGPLLRSRRRRQSPDRRLLPSRPSLSSSEALTIGIETMPIWSERTRDTSF